MEDEHKYVARNMRRISTVLNAAKDYDIDVDIVQKFYDRHNEEGLFFEKLEEYIEQRRRTA